MAYTNAPHFQQGLRDAIKHDLQGPIGLRRTGAAIVRALNQFLIETDRKNRVIDEIENTDRYIRNFARGIAWLDDATKELLWEMYIHEGSLVVISSAEISLDAMARIFGAVFRGATTELESFAGLAGRYLIYKKSLKDPANLVVRGYIEFKAATSDTLTATEIHINRSYSDSKSKPQEEEWIGALLARERSFSLITREKKKGTPKFIVLEIAHREDNRVVSLQGYSVECIESWGGGATFRSGVFLERVDDDFDYAADSALIDLVHRDQLQASHPHVISILG